MIGAGMGAGPIVRPFYNHVAVAFPSIVRTLRGNVVSNGVTATLANVTLALNELLVVSTCFDQADSRIINSVAWGVTGLLQQGDQAFDILSDDELELWTIRAPVAATRNVVLTWSGPVHSVTIVESYTNITSNVVDRQATDAAPPHILGSIPDSGLTAVTSQAHELILGHIGVNTKIPFGTWIAPLVPAFDQFNDASIDGNYLSTAWYEGLAPAAFRAAFNGGQAGKGWAAFCTTFRAV